MVAWLLIATLFTAWMYYAQGQSCATPKGTSGECILVRNCPSLFALINKDSQTAQELALLRRSHCGYEGNEPKVCCNDSQQSTAPPRTSQKCYTPDALIGECLSLYDCPHLLQMLTAKPVKEQWLTYVQNSRCEGKEHYSVCCGQAGTTTAEVVPLRECTSTEALPDPRTECCGRDGLSGNRITGGNATAVDQYPWLVLIEYRNNNKISLLCGGVLISGRYVLTAGHCVGGAVLDHGTPINIRLGEYDTSNDGSDCVLSDGGGEDCTDGLQVIPIEKIIPHPQYDPKNLLRRNDIALIRMKQLAPYTDFIRPICLPNTDVLKNLPEEFTMYAAGWGAVNENTSASFTKQHVDLPYIRLEVCQQAYNIPRRKVTLWKNQLCAGGEKGKDSCKGDSGGPLMYENGRVFEVLGIVSFGTTPCGLENVPGVYTKVYEYMPWIRSNIRP